MSKVTAIVSAYYAKDYLEGRIANLLEQKPQPSIIVVCQYDSPEEAQLAGFDGIVKVIKTVNIPTVYAAWNMAIKETESDYITNANCDDRLFPGALAEMAKVLDNNSAIALVYSDVYIVEEIGGKPVGRFEWMEGGLDKLLKGCFIGPMPMWRRSLHNKYGYFDETLTVAGDYDFWLRLAAGGEVFRHISEPHGNYLKRDDSIEHREPVRASWETARVRARYRGELC